jgi:NADPH:quinone reductase-like Zn-dependent oxidoreductase
MSQMADFSQNSQTVLASQTGLSLWYERAGECALNIVPVASPVVGEVTVRAFYSAISRGTERLIFEERIPPSEYQRMRGPNQQGDFPFPVKYGYCVAGVVEAGDSDLVGKLVFVLHPHQSRFTVARNWVTELPPGLTPRRAVLAANMETALNGLWDSQAGAGDRVVVVGAGIVGLLSAWLASKLPGADVTIIDADSRKARFAQVLGLRFCAPDSAPADADVVIHASASAAGLATALGCAGFEARVVELSWFGAAQVPVPLGEAFHVKRLQLVSSQVGSVAASRRSRWDHARRMGKALDLLCDPLLDHLISDEILFAQAPVLLPGVFAASYPGLTAILSYM